MKRIHVHIFVDDITASTEFYNNLFTTEPSLTQDDYVRWEITDPPMNFAISNHGKPGIDHLGIQSEDTSELDRMVEQYNHNVGNTSPLDQPEVDQPEETSCCYARSTKSWLSDPQGIQWEIFSTQHNESTFHGQQPPSNCCAGTSCC